MSPREDPTALVPIEGVLSYRQGLPEDGATGYRDSAISARRA